MNKLAKFALTAVLGLAITFTLNACEENAGGGGGKLLETITYDDGRVQKFEYDKQNRIVKIDDKTITYADNLITVGTQKYAINGKTITVDGSSFSINGDGYIVIPPGSGCDGCEFFEYKDGNLTADNSGQGIGYEYDNKKSPLSGCTSPKWLMQILLGDVYASKNNIVKMDEENGSSTYKYEYDSDGFPVKRTDNNGTTTRYTYRGEPQTATAPAEKASGSTLTDTRDNKTYKTVKIGEQVWMAENLNFEAKGSKCYGEGGHILVGEEDEKVLDNAGIQANCKKYGRLYDWNTAKTACPSGWKLPSKAEWDVLITTAGGEKAAGKYLKAKSGWEDNKNGTDNYGFSALPGGGGNAFGNFYTVGYIGIWWSATEYNTNYYHYTLKGSDDVQIDYDNSSLFSIRCIQN